VVTARPRLVVGITGSSAPHYGIELLRALQQLGSVETHLVLSEGARTTLRIEAGLEPGDVEKLADVSHAPTDLAAPISSGSFLTAGMVVAPCSMKALAGIAHGYAADLLGRAADVTLKERRRLVLVPRETPLSLLHLRNMVAVTEAGAVVLPPIPAFYHRPQTIDDLVAHTVGKVLDQLGVAHDLFRRWS
jgi:polyprenyl P-hydroxybenzoate/phenylacrylic acid decarboxylase-like protein